MVAVGGGEVKELFFPSSTKIYFYFRKNTWLIEGIEYFMTAAFVYGCGIFVPRCASYFWNPSFTAYLGPVVNFWRNIITLRSLKTVSTEGHQVISAKNNFYHSQIYQNYNPTLLRDCKYCISFLILRKQSMDETFIWAWLTKFRIHIHKNRGCNIQTFFSHNFN